MAVPQRIVSLLPSSTEILCALGLETRLVGLSHLCDYPPHMMHLPRLTAPACPTPAGNHGGAGARQTLVGAGLSAYHLDIDLLCALRPDLIVTQDRTAVSSVSDAEMLEATRRVLGAHVDVLSLHPTFLQDIWDDIYRLGEITGQSQPAAALLDGLFARVNAIVAESIMVRQPPRVAVLVWHEPLTLAGSWLPDLIQLAGGDVWPVSPGVPCRHRGVGDTPGLCP